MKSTILQIIVKEWFKDRLGGELEDVVIDAIIKELTEKKDNPITITDIEPRSNRIHYESKKDLEAKENKTNYYSEIQMSEAYDKGAYDQTNQSGHFNIHNYKPEFTKESDWISVNDRMPEENEHQCSEDVLTYYSLGLISIGFTHKGFWQNETGERNIEDVRNWKPLPKPPKNK